MNNKDKIVPFKMKLNSIEKVSDPTIMKAKFIVHDFVVSWNNAVISEDVCDENKQSLVNKPILCKYIFREDNNGVDALTDHAVTTDKDRNTGKEFDSTDTIAIGTITSTYIDSIFDENEVENKVLIAEAVLWLDKYPNICSLLQEWMDRNIEIHTSIELLYKNFSFIDGVEYIKSPIWYTGHCFLNSEQRGGIPEILPAYDISKLISLNEEEVDEFNKLVAQAINQQNSKKEECSNMSKDLFTKQFQLSHDDIRSHIYVIIDGTLQEDTYSYISEVFDDHFIVNIWGNGEDKYFKYTYIKNNESDEVTVDLESKTEVIREEKWIEVSQELETQLNSANETIENLQSQLNTVAEEKSTLEASKTELETQLNSKDGEITSLKEFKASVEEEKLQKQLSEKVEEQKEFYSKKFSALNAESKFDSEEVQGLIVKSVGEGEECLSSKMQLNEMLIDLVELKEEKQQQSGSFIKEFASTTQNLIPQNEDFDSVFGV